MVTLLLVGHCFEFILQYYWHVLTLYFIVCNRHKQPIYKLTSLQTNIHDWVTIITINTMTSLNGNIFHVTGHLCGEFTGHRWIPRKKASDAELWCFLWSELNKRLSKQSWGWWFDSPSHPYDVIIMFKPFLTGVMLLKIAIAMVWRLHW